VTIPEPDFMFLTQYGRRRHARNFGNRSITVCGKEIDYAATTEGREIVYTLKPCGRCISYRSRTR